MPNNTSYRIRTNVGKDKVLNIKLDQNYDFLEILSLKLSQANVYKLHTSKYGLIVGRVLANGGFGIPNAKISVFIQVSDTDINDPILSSLYPYNTTSSKDNEGIRYNLLPDSKVSDCYQVIGTFPNKRLVLDNDNVLEIYDNYYKYTTRTNEAGDYMIFGVPTGNQTVHVDLDLSDIGILSQRPRDLIYKGYNITQFENPNQFKKDTNIDSLTQVYSQDSMVYVYPFWGDSDEGTIAVSRNDIQIQYKFEPTCVFIGSIVSDNNSNGISKKCIATNRMGSMDELVTGNGTIEMIRKKQDGSVEEIQIQGTQLINGDGVWCYQIPMNLDYMTTDEYGNMIPTDNPENGIPTRTRVRFRISMQDFESDNTNNFRVKVLVPNNPKTKDELDYNFGSATYDDTYGTKSFRDLFWNNVYTVKSYIPRIQKGNNNNNERFTGIKHCNIYGNNNPIPYNNIRIRLPFMFVIVCAIIKCYIWIVGAFNWFNMRFHVSVPASCALKNKKCVYVGEGLCPDLEGWYFAPHCWIAQMKNTLNAIFSEDMPNVDQKSIDQQNNDGESPICITRNMDYFIQCVEINLAQEYKIINFDFYNDWVNGMIYIPRWIRNIRKKRSYLFGLIKIKPKIQACMESSFRNTRKYTQQCAVNYTKNNNTGYYNQISDNQAWGCVGGNKQKCHKGKGRTYTLIFGSNGGIVHDEKTLQNQSVYYFKPCEWKKVNGTDVRCVLFATDLVLLGSLNDCDLNGIPQAFKELQSSTYQMPTNLALTNMDSEGYMYGISQNGSGGSVCSNKVWGDSGVVIVDDNLETYRSWSKGTEFDDQEPEDDTTAITEAAGIDWGYSGPGQNGRDFNYLYMPGGHFLGVSCTNAEVNIKSCVNLSRMCEQGVWMSQRQEIPRKYDNTNNTFSYLAITPNGLIAKDEISDTDFRSMFATMNINRLKTEIDTNTGYLKYKFLYLRPTNFNGELENIVQRSTSVGDKYFKSDVMPSGQGAQKDEMGNFAIRRAIESASKDYYIFRMGIDTTNKNDNPKNHYLKQINNDVSLPMYENSFYFYFGLHDGSTALDEFKKQFFSTCPLEKEYIGDFDIQSDNASLCDETGGAVIKINDLTFPCRFSLLIDGKNNDVLDYEGCKKYLKGYFLRNATDGNQTISINGKSSNKWYIENNIENNNSYTESYYNDKDENVSIIYNKRNNAWFVGDKQITTIIKLSNGSNKNITFTPCFITYTSDKESVDSAYKIYDWSEVTKKGLGNKIPTFAELDMLDNEIGYYLYYTSEYGDSYIYTGKSFELHNLPLGTHSLIVIDSNAKTIEKDFSISQNGFESTITPINFTANDVLTIDDEKPLTVLEKSINGTYSGYINFNGNLYNGDNVINTFNNNEKIKMKAILYINTVDIDDNSNYHINYVCTNDDEPTAYTTKWKEVIKNSINIPSGKTISYNKIAQNAIKNDKNGIGVWEANVYYNIYVVYQCSPSETGSQIICLKIGNYLVSSPSKFKLIFGSSKLLDYEKNIAGSIENKTNWWGDEKNSEVNNLDTNFSPITAWAMKKMLFYENPIGDGQFGYSNVIYSGGTSPVTMTVYGQGEKVDDYGNLSLGDIGASNDISDDYSLTLTSVGIPTWNYKLEDSVERANFGVKIGDASGTNIPSSGYFTFPAMYRPFYFNTVMWNLPNIIEPKIVGNLYNGITYNKTFGENSYVIMNGNKYYLEFGALNKSDMYVDNSKLTDYNINGRIVDLSKVLKNRREDSTPNLYELNIVQGAPPEEILRDSDLEQTSISESAKTTFYDSFSSNINNDEIEIIGSGNTSNAVYFLINVDGTPYEYPYDDNGNLKEDAFIFRNDLNNNNIVEESNNNVIKLSFENNKAKISTIFENVYIVGMNKIEKVTVSDDNITANFVDNLNTFAISKLYGAFEKWKYNFTTVITLNTTNKELTITYTFNDDDSLKRFSNKKDTSCVVKCETVEIKWDKQAISSGLVGNVFTFTTKTLSDEDFEIFNTASSANAIMTIYGIFKKELPSVAIINKI